MLLNELSVFKMSIQFFGKAFLRILNSDIQLDLFFKVKELVTSEQVLTHYDPEKPIKLAFDASTYGIGAVISHIIEGHEKPIAFASPTLNPEEKNFAHIDKEALGLIWGNKEIPYISLRTKMYSRD